MYVKPKSKKFEVEVDEHTVLVSCREAPVKGKGNGELHKQLSRARCSLVAKLSLFQYLLHYKRGF
jgi:uncharacterized protein YggU (UPF0235/DUF167 family)